MLDGWTNLTRDKSIEYDDYGGGGDELNARDSEMLHDRVLREMSEAQALRGPIPRVRSFRPSQQYRKRLMRQRRPRPF